VSDPKKCIAEVVKASKGSIGDDKAMEMLVEYDNYLQEQRAAGNMKAMDLTPDEQFERHLAKKGAQKKWSWLNDKVVMNKRFNSVDFTSKKTIKKSFDEINSSAQRLIAQNQAVEDAEFTKLLKPEDRVSFKTRKYNQDETVKILGQMMVPEEEAHLIPKLGDIDPQFHKEYRIAEAMSTRLKAIQKQKNYMGANTGFLKGYIGRNNYDQLAYATPEVIDTFKKDALERFNWDEMAIGTMSREEYVDQLVERVRNGLFGTDVDELQYYDEVAQAKKTVKEFVRGSLVERLGKQRKIQMSPENAYYMHQRYGSGDLNNIFKTEIQSWGRSKGLLQAFGSNPDQNYDKLIKKIVENSTEYGEAKSHFIKETGEGYKDYLLGRLNNPAGHFKARVFESMRSFMSALHLGGGLFTSLADISTPGLRKSLVQMEGSIGGNLRIMTESLGEQLAMIAGDYGDETAKKIVKGMVEEMEDSLFDFYRESRFGGDVMGVDLKGRTAGGKFSVLNIIDDAHETVQKFNFIDWWTKGAIKRQYAPIAREFGEFADSSFDSLPDFMKQHLRNHSLDKDWDIIRSLKITSKDGRHYIDPQAFREIDDNVIKKFYPELKAERSIANKKDELNSTLRAAFAKEAETRVLMPDVTTSANVAAKLQKGRIGHELAMTVFQFKSYPIALWKKLIAPAFSQGIPTVAAFTAFSMGTNMMIVWLNDFLNNRTPRPFTTSDDVDMDVVAKNWGGLLGRSVGYPFADEILGKIAAGDFQVSDGASVLGPVFGDTMRTFKNLSDIKKGVFEGESDKAELGAAKLVAGAPIIGPALRGTAITKPLTNFALNNIYETFSPGYLTKQERYAEEQGSEVLFK
jgi:hypothetical protein